MGKFHLGDEFKRRFEKMDLAELQRWHSYWVWYTEQFPPNARKWGMSRVHDVERAIRQNGGEVPERCFIPKRRSPASSLTPLPTQKATALGGRIMYIERKAGSLTGSGRIGRVTFSQTGRTLYYKGQKFQSLKGKGFKSNYYDMATGEDYWISGPKRGGGDALYGGSTPIEIDDDVREEYWREIRRKPNRTHERVA
jgi:hypothetical protein